MSLTEVLPPEILQHVFFYIPLQLLTTNAQVCKLFNDVINLPSTWKKPLIARLGIDYEKVDTAIHSAGASWIILAQMIMKSPRTELLWKFTAIDQLMFGSFLEDSVNFKFSKGGFNQRRSSKTDIAYLEKITVDGIVKVVCHPFKLCAKDYMKHLYSPECKYDVTSKFMCLLVGGLLIEEAKFAERLIESLISAYEENKNDFGGHRLVQFLCYMISYLPLPTEIISNTYTQDDSDDDDDKTDFLCEWSDKFLTLVKLLSPHHFRLVQKALDKRIEYCKAIKNPLTEACFIEGLNYKKPITFEPRKPLKIKQNMSIWDMTPMDIAIDYTLQTHKMMRACQIKYHPTITHSSLMAIIARFNNHSNYLIGEILSFTEIKERARRIKFMIEVIGCFVKLGNTNDATLFLSVLQNCVIYRLKSTYLIIQKKWKDIHKQLCEYRSLISAEKGYMALRRFIRKRQDTHLPQIPYLGLFLCDLTFIKEGHVATAPFVSVQRWEKAFQKTSQFIECLVPCYNYKSNHFIQQEFEKWHTTMCDNDFYRISMNVEPRNRGKKKK